MKPFTAIKLKVFENTKGKMKYIRLLKPFLMLILLLAAEVSLGQVDGDYQTSATGNWNANTTWQVRTAGAWVNCAVGDYPGATAGAGTVYITDNRTVTITANVPNAIGALSINGGGNDSYLQFNAGFSLTVTGQTYLNSNSNGDEKAIRVDAGIFRTGSVNSNSNGNTRDAYIRISTGTVTVDGDIALNSTNLQTYVLFTSSGTLSVGGTITGGNITSAAGGGATGPTSGTVNFNGTSQTIANYTYFNLSTSNAGVKSLATNATINGNLTIQSGSTLDLAGFTANTTGGGTLSIDGTSTLLIGGTGTFPTGYSYSFAPSSVVDYNGSNQNITALNYSTLRLSNAGTKTLQGNITPSGNLTVQSGATFDIGTFTANSSNSVGTFTVDGTSTILVGGASSFPTNYANTVLSAGSTVNYNRAGVQTVSPTTYSNLTLSGSGAKTTTGVTINGTFSLTGTASVTALPTYGGAATLQYNGSTAQTSGLELPASISGLTINNAAGVNITADLSVSSALSLTSGVLTMSATKILKISSDAGIISGGSATSYIDGILSRVITNGSSYNYPIGSSGCGYHQLTLSNLNTTAASEVKVTFTCTGATTGDGIGIVAPILGINWHLEVVSGTFTDASALIEGSEIDFTHSMAKASAQAGNYSAIASTPALGSLTATAIGAIATDTWLGVGTPFLVTLYSYQSGDWSAASTWTLDPSGTTSVGAQVPPNNATLIILSGRVVSLTADVATTALDLTIKTGAILNLNTWQFSTPLTALYGQGILKLASANFPTATINTFTDTGGGTTEYDNTADFTLPITQSTYNNLTIKTSAGIIATQLSDITLNGNLKVQSGTYRINNNTATTKLNLIINGNLTVENGAFITVGNGTTNTTIGGTGGTAPFLAYYENFHRVVIKGDFTNNGTVKFTNLAYPLYNTFPPLGSVATSGAASVYFQGTTNNTLTCNGVTDFYNLIIDKGIDKTYNLTINSTDYSNFRLFGANNQAYDVGGTASDPNMRKALWLRNGKVTLKGSLIIPSLTEGTAANTQYFIPFSAALITDGIDVVVNITADTYEEVNIAYGVSGGTGLVNGVVVNGNNSMYVYGRLQVDNGLISTKESAGMLTSNTASGQLIINGGTVDSKQLYSPTGSASYSQSGGILILRGRFLRTPAAYSSISDLKDMTTGSLNTARATNGINATTGTFNLEQTTNIFTMSGGTIRIYDVTSDTNEEAFDIKSSTANISVIGGTIEIIPTTGSLLADPANYLINSNAALSNLTISRTGGAAGVQLSKALIINNNFTLNSGAFSASTFDLTVGGNFTLETGTTFTTVNNTTTFNGSGIQAISLNLSSLSFYNLVIDKPLGIAANVTGTLTNFSATNNFQLIEGTLNINTGMALNLAGSVYNSGIQTGAGKITLNGTVTQTIDGNGIFENLELFNTNATAAPISLVANTTVNGVLTLSNDKIFKIGTYNLKLNGAASILNASNTRYIQTAGNAGDGGITKVYAATSFIFPVGVVSYTPASLSLSTTPTVYGSITVIPVNYAHPNVTSTGRSLSYFFRVKSSGFTLGSATVTHGYTYAEANVVTGAGISEAEYVPARFNVSASTWTKGTLTDIDITNNIIGEPNSGTFFENVNFIDGDYTAGDDNPTNPFGTPVIYYSRQSGLWSSTATWSLTSHTVNNPPATAPNINDIVIIGNGHAVTFGTPANYLTTANTEPHYCASLKIEAGSSLDIRYNPGSNFGMVLSHPNGNGTFRLSTSSTSGSTFTMPSGDFSEFNQNLGTTELYSTNATAGTTYWLPNGTTNYGNLIISPLGGSNIIFPNNDVTIYGNLITRGQNADSWFLPTWDGNYPTAPTARVSKTITILGDFDIQGGAFGWYGNNGGGAQNVVVNGDLIVSAWGAIDVWSSNTSQSLSIGGSLINNTNNATQGGVGTPSNVNLSLVPTTFFGANNASITNTSGTPGTTFGQLTINKGNSQATTLTCNISGTLSTPTNNWLTIQNGTFIYNRTNPSSDFTISTTNTFTIPATAGLTINLPSNTGNRNVLIANAASNTNDLYLDGKLTLINGNLYIGATAGTNANNNDIEYSGSGASCIDVQGGNLMVNGQIRRPTNTTNGILNYTQSGGTVVINGQNSNVTYAKLEVLNTGSVFNMSGGTLTIVRGGGTTYGDLFIRPTNSTVSGGTIVFSQTPSLGPVVDAIQSYQLESNTALYGLTITGKSAATARNATVTLMVNPLALNGSLTLSNANSIFNSNNLNVSLKGDFNNSGTYNYGTNLTTFNGVSQTITGTSTSDFYDLTINSSSSTTIGKNFTVYRNLVLQSGNLVLNTFKTTVLGNFTNNAAYTDNNTTGGISLAGSILQQITGTGAYGKLEINNTAGARLNNDIILQNDLALTAGILDINQYLLTIGSTGAISGAPFSSAKMIQTDGVASNLGVRKYFNTSPQTFTVPIGVNGKYTPAVYVITANGTVGYITTNPIKANHPTVSDPTNVLKYYWQINSAGISAFNGMVQLTYETADIQGDESTYIAARLESPGDYWFKAAAGALTDNVDENNNLISFSFTGSSNLSGDYTAGLNTAIPDQVPSYISNKDGNWSDETIWDAVGSAPACPAGGPNGAIVIIDHVVSTNNNYSFAYKTTINGELRIVSPTYGHNLGTVNGSGKLYMETGTMPAGNYTSFLDCTGNATIEYGGNTDYTNIAGLYNTVPNLIFSGTGIRTLYDTDLTICKNLQINGPTLDNSSNNRKLTIGGTMELAAGHFWAGTGNAPAATVTFAGTSQQTIGNPGNFIGEDAFNNLEINNAAGLVIGTGATVEVNNNLLLTNGVITTATNNQLIVTNTSTTAISPTSGSLNSFIDGPLTKKIINGDEFNFPIGKGNTLGNYFTLKSAAGATTYWTGEYMSPTTGSLTAPLLDINKFEYWRIKSTATYNATVKINWDLQSNLYPGMTPNGMADMRVAHYNTGTSKWEMVGDLATTSTTGTITAGAVTNSTNVSIGTGGEDFTIGSVEIARPLARFASTVDVCGAGTNIPIQFSSTVTIYLDYTITYTIDGVTQPTVTISSLPYNLPTTTPGVYRLTAFTYKDEFGVTQNGFVGSGTVNNYANPTIADAGDDQPLCSLSGTTLAANPASVYTSQAWSVVSGIGGVFVDNLVPGTTFTGNLGFTYNLRWTISNYTCTSSDDVLISFSIAAAKPSDFTAAQSVICTEGHAGRIYTVPIASGVWYNWSYSGAGATINAPTNTNSVVIDFDNTATSGTVSVTAENGCGVSAPRTIAVTVAPRGGWVGSSGNLWSATNNWSCPGLPLNTTPVTISSGAPNQPLIDFAGAVCNTLNIGAGASLTISGNNYLDVYGDWTNNGSFIATNTSTVNFKGNSAINGASENTFGNIVIASGASLTGPAGNMNILGNWTDDDNGIGFTPSTSTVIFSGSTPQTFTAPNGIKTFNNLIVESGSDLTISEDSRLSITGNTTIMGRLNLKSSATSTSSFIDNGITQTGIGFVERAINEQWHYHGLPIESVQNTFFNQKNIYYFDEAESDAWGANDFTTVDRGWKVPIAGDLATNYGAARGFAYYYYESNLGYTGKLNTGNKSVTLSYTNTPQDDIYDGWNLIGNPYVSAIDWALVDKTNIDDAVYYYKDMDAGTPNTANYATYIGGVSTNGGSRYVPQMQGFFVKAKPTANGQALTFTNAMRVHPPDQTLFYKKSELTNTSDFIKLNVGSKDVFDESVVLFNSEATNLHDSKFDAYKLFTKELLVPQIYSVGENDIMYAINTLTEFDENTEIPLGIRVGISGEYAINIVETNITDKANIYLFDKKHNEFIQLYKGKQFNFYVEKGNYLNRFSLMFSNKINNPKGSQYEIFSAAKTIYVKAFTETEMEGEITVFDISGRKVAYKQVSGEFNSAITVDAADGIYIVQLKINDEVIKQKVLLSKQ